MIWISLATMQTPLIALTRNGTPCVYKLKNPEKINGRRRRREKNLKKKRNQTVANSNKEQFQLFTLRHFTYNVLVAIAFAFVKRFSKAASWQFLRSFLYFKSCLSFLFLVRIRYCTGLRPLFSRCPLLMCLVDWLNSLYQLAQIQML